MKTFMFSKNMEFADLGIILKSRKGERTLVICDTHIGKEETLQKSGILVPTTQFSDLNERILKLINNNRFDNIVINGDVKHEFGTISDSEWKHTLTFIDLLLNYTRKLVLVKGNHDTILEPITSRRKIEVVDFFRIDDILITHGHKLYDDFDFGADIKTIIIGHEHPAISISDGIRKEQYKCFIAGKWKNKTLIVQPSFDLYSPGIDLIEEAILSPYLKQNLENFEVFIVNETKTGSEVIHFSKIKNLNLNQN